MTLSRPARLPPVLLFAAAVAVVPALRTAGAQDNVLGIPTTRDGSGTSWVPDASPMRAAHASAGAWTIMAHGVAFLQYDRQDGPRGGDQVGSVNWAMLMGARPVGAGWLQLRGMVSLEPFTLGANGYPLLLQTGETFHGAPLVDRQHPHDLFMELSAQYERAVSRDIAMSLYVAPVGEPAAGPVAFPHRPSAAGDPFAPLSHHWQDATHVVFGTVTAGVFTKAVKLEGSVFNAREPDEIRTNFDFRGASLDSYAGRVTVNPGARWSLAGTFAYLRSPEALHPGESLHRVTLSALYSRPLGDDGSLAATAVYGVNHRGSGAGDDPSWLLEATATLNPRDDLFARAEFVAKDSADLASATPIPDGVAHVTSFVLGYSHDLTSTGPLRLGVGARASVNVVGDALGATYGTRTPAGIAVYLRLRPALMSADGMGAMHGMPMSADGERASRR